MEENGQQHEDVTVKKKPPGLFGLSRDNPFTEQGLMIAHNYNDTCT